MGALCQPRGGLCCTKITAPQRSPVPSTVAIDAKSICCWLPKYLNTPILACTGAKYILPEVVHNSYNTCACETKFRVWTVESTASDDHHIKSADPSSRARVQTIPNRHHHKHNQYDQHDQHDQHQKENTPPRFRAAKAAADTLYMETSTGEPRARKIDTTRHRSRVGGSYPSAGKRSPCILCPHANPARDRPGGRACVLILGPTPLAPRSHRRSAALCTHAGDQRIQHTLRDTYPEPPELTCEEWDPLSPAEPPEPSRICTTSAPLPLLALSTRPQTRGATVRSRLCALACRGVVYTPAWALLVWRLGMVAMWGQLPGHAPEPSGCDVWCASRLSRGRPRCRDSSLDTRLNLGGVMFAVRGQ